MKLGSKITIALVAIAVVATLIFGVIFHSTTNTIFSQYVEQQRLNQQQKWVVTLESYYDQVGSWENLDAYFFQMPMGMGGMMRQHRVRKGMIQDRIILFDTDKNVLLDTQPIGTDYKAYLEKAEPLVSQGKLVGYVAYNPRSGEQFQPLEQQFYASLQKILLWGGLITVVLAATLGAGLSRLITTPLRELTLAVEKLKPGGIGEKVKVTGSDEIGQLAVSFNSMLDSLAKHERLRRNLMADVAHELRTPLAIVRGNLERLINSSPEFQEQSNFMEIIASLHDEILRLSRLVAELQELTLVEAGKVKMELSQVNLFNLGQQIITIIRAEAESRGVKLNYQTNLSPEEEALLDKDRITQVIINLLTNALKHTRAGGEVLLDIKDTKGEWCFTVLNTGKGIEPEYLPYIFDRFYRADEARNRSEGGLGLGLAIAKVFVDAHGGKIWVENILNKGTAFIFTIPKAD